MKNKLFLRIAIGIAVVVVGLVSLLYFSKPSGVVEKSSVIFLPRFHAILNSLTAISLVTGAWAIYRKKNKKLHASCMITAFVLSAIFLISYVTYHYLAPSTKYGGEGALRGIYFLILITHILLAIVVVPFVLLSLFFAITKQFDKHKKIVKWTLPIWLYVAISGVLVYLMISPYY